MTPARLTRILVIASTVSAALVECYRALARVALGSEGRR